MTQPIPIVAQPAPPPRPGKKVKSVPPPPGPGGPYVHRFGSWPLYLLARLGGFAIDILGVSFVLTAFGFNAYIHGISAFAARTETGFIALASGALGIAILLAYLCEALMGTTIGKLTFSLHTRRVDGGHAGGLRVLVRYLFMPVDLLLIGPILAAITPRHQRLGDLLAGTVVSGSRLRWFSPVIGIVLVAAIAYAQIAYGGSLTSAIEVLAETSNVAPGVISRTAQSLGFGAVHVPPIPVPALPSALPALTSAPSALPSAPAALPSPLPSETAAPASGNAAPATSDAPDDSPAPAITEPASGTPDPGESAAPEPGPSGVY